MTRMKPCLIGWMLSTTSSYLHGIPRFIAAFYLHVFIRLELFGFRSNSVKFCRVTSDSLVRTSRGYLLSRSSVGITFFGRFEQSRPVHGLLHQGCGEESKSFIHFVHFVRLEADLGQIHQEFANFNNEHWSRSACHFLWNFKYRLYFGFIESDCDNYIFFYV